MANQLKAGVVGLGILGRQHADFLHAHPMVTLAAVCDLRKPVAEDAGQALGAQAYTDYAEMFRQEGLDLAVIATPDHLHRAPAVAAAEAGIRNILCEKPLATTVEDGEAIYNAVERAGTTFYINFANRAAPLDIATRYVIQNGLLGEVVYGEARLDDNITVPTQMWGDRTREFAGGSSTAHFLLSHVVDLLRWYFAPAEVNEVYAITQNRVLGYTPDLYDAFLTFDSGLKVRVKAEWIKHIDELVEFYIHFSGSDGTVIYNKRAGFGARDGWRANLARSVEAGGLLKHQDALRAAGVRLGARVHYPSPATAQLKAGGGEQMLSLETFEDLSAGTMGLAGPVIDSIVEGTLTPASWQGRGPLPTQVDGLRQTQIVAAIVESSKTGRVVKVAR